MNNLLQSSAVGQAEAIRDGWVSSEELVRVHLDRIAVVNPKLNAVVQIDADAEWCRRELRISASETERRSDSSTECHLR